MQKRRLDTLLASALAATSLAASSADDHATGTGISLKPVKPEGVNITIDGKEVAVPGGGTFSMAQTEVTKAQFERLLGHNPAETDAEHLPVDRVTATEAAAFCKALSERDRAAGVLPEGKIYRLPTLREWLLAALPGGLLPETDALDAMAWHKDNSAELLHPVGAKTANAYGLQDMVGNAAEWVTPDAALTKNLEAGNPARFHAKTLVQVQPPAGMPKGEAPAMTFRQTQFEIIQARGTLDRVVDRMGLAEKWEVSAEKAAERVRANLRVKGVRGTDLIEIGYRGDTREEPAAIANGVAESYRGRLTEESKKRAVKAIATLEELIPEQQKKLEKSRVKMLALMEEFGIIDLSKETPAWLKDAKPQPAVLMRVRDKLEELKRRERIDAAIEHGLQSPVLKKRHAELQEVEAERTALLNSGFGTKHPKVVVLDRKISQLETMCLDAIDLASAEIEKDSLEERRQNIRYIGSKEDYQLNKETLYRMQSQLAKTKIDARSPTLHVVVHERAVAPPGPARPPGADGPIAVGGSVYDPPADLADPRSTDPGARTDGVGFRFVLVDE